jgi:transposase-like protein
MFANSNLPLTTLCNMMFDWVCEVPVTMSAPLNDVSEHTAINWYECCRQLCTRTLLGMNNVLGGPEHIVEIDESVMFKRKFHVGHQVRERWVFGAWDHTDGRGMLQHVNRRDMATLWPIIQRWVQPGSIIHHDGWASYNNLQNMGFRHEMVNHQIEFANINGATTNHVESYWSRIKRRMKYLYGSQGELQWSHLDEIQYRMWFGWKNATVFANWAQFLHHVRNLYPL